MNEHSQYLIDDPELDASIKELEARGVQGKYLSLPILLHQLEEAYPFVQQSQHRGAVARLALYAGTHFYSYGPVLEMFKNKDPHMRFFAEAAFLQGIAHATPFSEVHFKELMVLLQKKLPYHTNIWLMQRMADTGPTHAPALWKQWLPVLAYRPRMPCQQDRTREVMQILHHFKGPAAAAILKGHLLHSDGAIRERVAKHLVHMGWQPRGRSEMARYAVARRNLKAVQHLRDKMGQAISVIQFPEPAGRTWSVFGYDHPDYDMPEIAYYLEVVKQLPELYDPWKMQQILRLSRVHLKLARTVQQSITSA